MDSRPSTRPLLLRAAAGLALVGMAAGACSALPARQASAPAAGASGPARVTVHGARGPVGAVQEARTLENMADGPQDTLARLHLDVLRATGDVDLYRGNRVRLLVDGPATFAAMKAAISRARSHIFLESYIVEDRGVAAQVAELLLKKAAQGVRVALIYDAVGSIGTPREFFAALADGGVATCEFNPVNPTRRPGYWGINHRDHRKLLVVDDEVAFTGGINISRVYGSGSFRRSASPGDALDDGWRDTQVEIRGPAVPAMTDLFAQTWHEQGCKSTLDRRVRTTAGPREPGERIVKLLASDPTKDPGNRIYTALLAAVQASRRSIHLTMAYFAPGEDFVQALCDAARRGVSVEMVLPGRSDFPLVLHAGRSYYTRMLDAGIKLYEMEHAMMHAKSAVIDGVFSTVGSSNLDWRSLVANNELNAIVLGEDFGAELEAQFARDRNASVPIDAGAWARRGLHRRAMEWVGRAAERLL